MTIPFLIFVGLSSAFLGGLFSGISPHLVLFMSLFSGAIMVYCAEVINRKIMIVLAQVWLAEILLGVAGFRFFPATFFLAVAIMVITPIAYYYKEKRNVL